MMAHTHNEKQDGEHDEAHELEGFATPRVDNKERSQVTGQEGRGDDDHGIYDVIA